MRGYRLARAEQGEQTFRSVNSMYFIAEYLLISLMVDLFFSFYRVDSARSVIPYLMDTM